MSKAKRLSNLGVLVISLILSVSSYAAQPSVNQDITQAKVASKVIWHGGGGIFG